MKDIGRVLKEIEERSALEHGIYTETRGEETELEIDGYEDADQEDVSDDST